MKTPVNGNNGALDNKRRDGWPHPQSMNYISQIINHVREAQEIAAPERRVIRGEALDYYDGEE